MSEGVWVCEVGVEVHSVYYVNTSTLNLLKGRISVFTDAKSESGCRGGNGSKSGSRGGMMTPSLSVYLPWSTGNETNGWFAFVHRSHR